MEKALNDFFDAAEKVIPTYQNQAKEACTKVICTRIFKSYKQHKVKQSKVKPQAGVYQTGRY